MWSVGASVAARVFGLVGTLYMTRLLAPEVIGEVSAAAVLAYSANWLSHWGFNQYMVLEARGDSEGTYHVAVLNAAFAVVALAGIALTGSLFAPLLKTPHLAAFLPGLALAVLIRRITGVADKILVRELRFREVAVANASGEFVFTISAVGIAATTRLGGQAIVIGNIAQAVVEAVLIWRCTRLGWFRRARWSWARVREILRYGIPLGVAQVLNSAARSWDNLAFSALFGGRVLGLYNMAYNLAAVPAVQVGEQIALVFAPALQNVRERDRKPAVIRAMGLMALLVFPMAIGLGAIAQSLIAVLLRPEWQGVAPLLTVLCVLSVFRPITWAISAHWSVCGRTRMMMLFEALKVALLIGCIVTFAALGPLWAAGAVGLAFAIHAVAMVILVARVDRFSVAEIAGTSVRPLFACFVMAAAVLAVRQGLDARGFRAHPVGLVVEILVGALVYTSVALIVARDTSLELIRLLRRALRRD